MAVIQALRPREILDSRGDPTIELELETQSAKVAASVPAGASVGVHEAHELRDNGGASRGVSEAVAHIRETIASAVIGKKFDQRTLDSFLCELDGTGNKSRLGANAILAVSVAFARAQAQELNIPLFAYLGSLDGRKTYVLPQPLFNVLNGGKHAAHGIDIQECMLAPVEFPTMREKVRAAEKCVAALRMLLVRRDYGVEMGDEGGFAPALPTNDEALELLVAATAEAGYTSAQVKIALDVAASSFYRDGTYLLKAGGREQLANQKQMLGWYVSIAKRYPVISIEDGFAEDDWEGFAALVKELGGTLAVVGDDLTVTNIARIKTAVEKQAANACIVKPNQIGTVSEAVDAVRAARAAGWKTFASHRSGETMDTFIADFAVGLGCDYLKAGSPTRPERIVKYNRLMEIEKLAHPI